jgi:hypothetical protein
MLHGRVEIGKQDFRKKYSFDNSNRKYPKNSFSGGIRKGAMPSMRMAFRTQVHGPGGT